MEKPSITHNFVIKDKASAERLANALSAPRRESSKPSKLASDSLLYQKAYQDAYQKAYQEGFQEGRKSMLVELVNKKLIAIKDASEILNISEEAFVELMRK